ncbi:hypothetical protein FC34_GL001038 [Lacticaseibacillus brantae DSM 23927]|uniref:Uncharacterized protein n=1 Tax=Lacticaseibacillus brantae DSM 23927 TaxID=1423727 RepID=A0A0R2AYA9_9LACO|nr:hypothetical protein FC34_GL001038 [Lacticaseibacillus brantae DSM 23927]
MCLAGNGLAQDQALRPRTSGSKLCPQRFTGNEAEGKKRKIYSDKSCPHTFCRSAVRLCLAGNGLAQDQALRPRTSGSKLCPQRFTGNEAEGKKRKIYSDKSCPHTFCRSAVTLCLAGNGLAQDQALRPRTSGSKLCPQRSTGTEAEDKSP